MGELIDLIKGLTTKRFYGTLEIKFEAGRVVLVRQTETIKLGKQKQGVPIKYTKEDHKGAYDFLAR